MTKKELLEAMAAQAEISQAAADKALGALVDAIAASVAKGDRVAIPGLGTFEKRERSARTGRNPQTGAEIKIAATSVPGFKPATQFKATVADSKAGKKAAKKK
ncbi:HU family DNA-binding protein [Enemella evansiae]|uniref:DNA-binding protein n=1 Tax=Enemella evansiae TaxID=2016499 RepID=A0A255GF74_9ACTN|nr:HU family DNA-binding protein [Enemella evansiae]PFG66210.1 DNA-binding protein HU-beta [Propionibacteriaceae bacterium ES.041]OYN95014.1 DNA-binding protein [Enemella evansiae]OYO04796.1 DNA-binding protein [Enemella evansiae]OYO06437.1 DNA-binding protein [Enemella evansiae]OYO07799.1 DNA-binding protein [Enemella evansiae]